MQAQTAKWHPGWALHQGGRNEQQDSAVVMVSQDQSRAFAVVADGMGGHEGGAMASGVIVEVARELWNMTSPSESKPQKMLDALIHVSHKRIVELSKERGLDARSTIAALLIDQDQAYMTNVGDSRIYGIKGTNVDRLTRDDSLLEIMLKLGEITEDQMADHPDQNKLTKSVGGDDAPPVRIKEMELNGSISFVLCSDGLWESVTTGEFARAVMTAPPERAAQGMAHLAAQRAGRASDNIAVIVLQRK